MSIADTNKKVSFGYTPCLMEEGAIGAERSQNLVRVFSKPIIQIMKIRNFILVLSIALLASVTMIFLSKNKFTLQVD